MANQLRLAFVNVNGLDQAKFDVLNKLLVLDQLDILIVAETWFVDHARFSSHPFFLCSTGRSPAGARATGHAVGGTYVLCSTRMRARVGQIRSIGHNVSFRV